MFIIKQSLIGFTLLLILAAPVHGQFRQNNAFPASSPDAMSIARNITTPVNLYAGIPQIAVDLYTLEGRSGIKVPITLGYHAGGHKVQDISGNIGLGWSASFTSMITRFVKGLPDEGSNGYFGSSMGSAIYENMSSQTLNEIINLQKDSEPDIFQYNLNGVTGRFVLDKDKNPVMLPDKGIKILNSPFKREMGKDGWIMADLDGNQFFLGTDNTCTETTTSVITDDGESKTLTYTSGWYLKTFITANQTDTATYTYSAYEATSFKYYNAKHVYRTKRTTTTQMPRYIWFIKIRDYEVDSEVDVMDNRMWTNNTLNTVASPKYLQSIQTANQKAIFYYDMVTKRKDLMNGRALQKIEIKTSNNSLIKTFVLHQSYFQSQNVVQADLITSLSTESNPHATYDNFRLRLDSVSEAFPSNERSVLARMQYNTSQLLPPRSSKKIDHWGYYNNNTKAFFEGVDNELILPANIEAYYDESKRPDEERMKANILQEITYKNGAGQSFHYETNRWNKNGVAEAAGGLRMSRTIQDGGDGTIPIETTYTYANNGLSTGKLSNSLPSYLSMITHSLMGNFIPSIPLWGGNFQPSPISQPTSAPHTPPYQQAWNPGVAVNSSYVAAGISIFSYLVPQFSTTIQYSPFMLYSFISFNDLFDTNGNTVGYSEVTVRKSGLGKEVNRFLDIDSYPDASIQLTVNSSFQPTGKTPTSMSPYTPNTSYAFARGRLKEKILYDESSHVVRRTVYEYAFGSKADSVMGFKCSIGHVNVTSTGAFQSVSSNLYNVGYYFHVSKPLWLKRAIEESYTTNSSLPVKTITDFSYHPDYPVLLKEKSMVSSDGAQRKTALFYVADKALINYSNSYETTAVNELYTNKRFGLLLEQRELVNDVSINAVRTGFKKFTINAKNLVLPEHTYQISNGTTRVIKSTLNYDQFGNATDLVEGKNLKSTYGWSKDGVRMTYQCSNAGKTEVFFEDFEEQAVGPTIIQGNAASGKKYYKGNYTLNFTKPNSRSYKYSYYYLTGGLWQYSGYAPYTQSGVVLQGEAIDRITVVPADAVLTSYSYNEYGELLSQIDESGNTEYYEYDGQHRIQTIRNYNRALLKTFAYHHPVYNKAMSMVFTRNNCADGYPGTAITYTIPAGKYGGATQAAADSLARVNLLAKGQAYANQNSGCTAVLTVTSDNIVGSLQLIDRNNQTFTLGLSNNASARVPGGYYDIQLALAPGGPENILLTVGGRSHILRNSERITGVSIQDVMTVKANKTYYKSTAQTRSFRKNDCTGGLAGSWVDYTVPYNRYASHISQADANNQAIAEINANGQLYANQQGICTDPNATVVVNNVYSGIIIQFKKGGSAIKTISPPTGSTTYQFTDLPPDYYELQIFLPGSSTQLNVTVGSQTKTGNITVFPGVSVSYSSSLSITIN